jgi:hypothetical protein
VVSVQQREETFTGLADACRILVGTVVTQLILIGITATFCFTVDDIVSAQFQAAKGP